MKFNRSVIEYLARTKSIEVVVLSSLFLGSLADDGSSTVLSDGSVKKPSVSLANKHFVQTIYYLRSLGKRVIVVAPFPTSHFNPSVCWERVERNLLTIGANTSCAIDRVKFHEYNKDIRELLDKVQSETKVPIFLPETKLCNQEFCATKLDGVPLYRDEAHLSTEGSAILGKKLGFGDLVWRLAD